MSEAGGSLGGASGGGAGGTSRASMGRKTNPLVRLSDQTATAVITVGGLAVLAAMLGICVFLVQTAAPLLEGGSAGERVAPEGAVAELTADRGEIAWVRLDAGPGRALLLTGEGRLLTVRLRDGAVVGERDLLAPDQRARCWSVIAEDDSAVAGLDDGRAVRVRFGYEWHLAPADAVPGAAGLEIAETLELDGPTRAALRDRLGLAEALSDEAYVQRVSEEDFRLWSLEVERDEPVRLLENGEALVSVDMRRVSARREYAAALGAEGTAVYAQLRRVTRLDGSAGPPRVSRRAIELGEGGGEGGAARPRQLRVTADGSSVLAVYDSGDVVRCSAEGEGPLGRTETTRVLPAGAVVRSLRVASGSKSLLIGDDGGGLTAVSVVPAEAGRGRDGLRLAVLSRSDLSKGDAGVDAISAGLRDRTIVAALSDGSMVMHNPTSGKTVARAPGVADPVAVGLSSDLSGMLAVGRDGSIAWNAVSPGHPEASWRAVFGRVHYEGYAEPAFVYQSTGAAGAEPKFSLVPLIWGTLKATIAAMVFAVPLGVLSAIYSSEFLHHRVRRVVKPTIELMASLPSVVLGFLAAMLVAPYVRDVLPAVLVGLVAVPLTVLLAGHAWRLVPERQIRRLGTLGHIALVTAVLGLGAAFSAAAGPAVASALFRPQPADVLAAAGMLEPAVASETPAWAVGRERLTPEEQLELRALGLFHARGKVMKPAGDPEQAAAELPESFLEPSVRRWLDGDFGGPGPGWLVALVGPCALLVFVLEGRLLGSWWAGRSERGGRTASGLLEILRFCLNVGATLLVAWVLAQLLTALRLDPRLSIFGPFSQRNTLVVGLVMGFAVIPIIYTISEDALRSVPQSLRSASYGVGATAWQTATRVVLPVAGSGVFSACMVGLGRAVGETMIVLMATGNTPEISANIFSGFRTLAANIAVELPEAPRGGAHYRLLFLCGLVLFLMTLVINTTAELVRQRFRKRSAAL